MESYRPLCPTAEPLPKNKHTVDGLFSTNLGKCRPLLILYGFADWQQHF